jgi:hypothetical protein
LNDPTKKVADTAEVNEEELHPKHLAPAAMLQEQWLGMKWATTSDGSTSQLGLRFNTAHVADDNFFVLVNINLCVVTIFDATRQNFLSEGVFEQTHHGATKRTGAVGGVVTLFHQTLFEGIRHGEGDAFLSHAAKHFFEHDLGDLFDFLSVELAEDNNLV